MHIAHIRFYCMNQSSFLRYFCWLVQKINIQPTRTGNCYYKLGQKRKQMSAICWYFSSNFVGKCVFFKQLVVIIDKDKTRWVVFVKKSTNLCGINSWFIYQWNLWLFIDTHIGGFFIVEKNKILMSSSLSLSNTFLTHLQVLIIKRFFYLYTLIIINVIEL